MKKIILTILIFIFLTGCTNNYNDINNLAIINEIAIDYNNSYEIYIKVLSTNQKNEDKIYKETGKSLNECFSSLNNKLTKKLYLAHLDLLILSNNLEKKQYKEIIEFFLNQETSRNNFNTVVVNKINKKFLTINSYDIENLLNLSIKTNGIAKVKTFDNLIKDILNYNLSYIPYINTDNNEIEGLKVIYDDNKILNINDSISVNFIFNLIDNITLLIDNNAYKIEQCNTINIIDENTLNIKVSCIYEGTKKDKEKIENYLNNIINNFIKNNNKNYFYYLENKFNLNNSKIKSTTEISLMKESSGDYFV